MNMSVFTFAMLSHETSQISLILPIFDGPKKRTTSSKEAAAHVCSSVTAFTAQKQSRTNFMENLKDRPPVIVGVHGEVIIQEAPQVLRVLDLVRSYHLDHRVPEICSWVVGALLHCHHDHKLGSTDIITTNLFRPMPPPVGQLPHFLPLSYHLIEPLLHHGMGKARDRGEPVRATALGFLGRRHTQPTAAAQCPAPGLSKPLLLLGCPGSSHLSRDMGEALKGQGF